MSHIRYRFLLPFIVFIFVLVNLYFASYWVRHGDIHFDADIARDFHLYDEIAQKIFVFIGPRSSVSGLFHGPLWLYINYPAYSFSGGNPAGVGWWWIALTIGALGLWFYVADRLFGRMTAYLYVSFMAVYSVFHAYRYFNPHGAYFVVPLFFYFFIRYFKTGKVRYLLAHVFTGGLLIQFQLAVGIPYMVLSLLYEVLLVIKKKVPAGHILVYGAILLPLANFIIFELRHNLTITHGVLHYLGSPFRDVTISYAGLLRERIWLILTGTEFLRENVYNMRLVVTILFYAVVLHSLKSKTHRLIYGVFLYFYLGYYAVSFINRGTILYFYMYPQFPLAFLIFASLGTTRWKKAFLVMFGLILALNFHTAYRNIQAAQYTTGIHVDSWKFQQTLAEDLYETAETGAGYFVFAPDAFGYPTKYALRYIHSRSEKDIVPYEKRPLIYVVEVPDPHLHAPWWLINTLRVTASPSAQIRYGNGYVIERFELSQKDIEAPTDPNYNPGMLFR